MRKFLFTAVILLGMAITGSYAQNKKVAVITFYVSKQIDVSDFGVAAKAAALSLSDEPDFNLTPLIVNFHDQFFSTYSKNFPFDLAPENEVLDKVEYRNYVPLFDPTGNPANQLKYNIPYDGYKIIINWGEAANVKNMLAMFNQYDGVMVVTIGFRLLQYGFNNMGVARMMAGANIELYNRDGVRVFSISDNGKSKSVSPMVAGVPVMTSSKVLPMCQDALDHLMTELNKDLPKLIKKANAKL